MKACAGCGIAIQTEDKSKPGFAPLQALKRDKIVCQRCFRITHYNEISSVSLDNKDYRAIVNSISEHDALVVMLIDLFDVAGSWIKGIDKAVGNNPILLVANKIDLFPLSITIDKIQSWLLKEAKSRGLHPVDIVVISASKGYEFDELVEKMENHRKDRNVYVVGAANVGKSTMINRLIKDYGEGLDHELTTSPYPGTTLQTVHIPLDDGSELIDTPGIINERQMSHLIAPEEIPLITPSKPIDPIVYQLNDQQTIFIGGLVRVDFVKGNRQSFVFYVAKHLNLHRTKLENAAELYENHKGELLSPPSTSNLNRLPAMEKHEFVVRNGEEKDIVISGLGWVAIKGTGANVVVHAPKGVHIGLRPSLI